MSVHAEQLHKHLEEMWRWAPSRRRCGVHAAARGSGDFTVTKEGPAPSAFIPCAAV